MSSPFEMIRGCKYLYMHTISEPEENTLRIVIHEATMGGRLSPDQFAEEESPVMRDLLASSNVIVHGPGCKVFELTWPSYIGYSVENESYNVPEPKESIGQGRLLVEYTKSVYLGYLAAMTFADSDFPGPFKHWAIYCLNHTVNVASTEVPRITVSTTSNPTFQRTASPPLN